jgi:hypothetical protein
VYGVRVADSRFGYKSLGKSRNISKAQHCRAEVFLGRFGWVPVDPADVRKVVREGPPGKLALDHPKVLAVRRQLFGAWEMNWLAYNVAHDLRLPGSEGPQVPFLMYPQGESAQGRFDSLDPDAFRYSLVSRELTSSGAGGVSAAPRGCSPSPGAPGGGRFPPRAGAADRRGGAPGGRARRPHVCAGYSAGMPVDTIERHGLLSCGTRAARRSAADSRPGGSFSLTSSNRS